MKVLACIRELGSIFPFISQLPATVAAVVLPENKPSAERSISVPKNKKQASTNLVHCHLPKQAEF